MARNGEKRKRRRWLAVIRCDNWIVSADSDAVQKYPPERRENGLLISKDWR